MVGLDSPDGSRATFALTLNDRGHVAGDAVTTTGEVFAFLWTPDRGMINIGSLEGASTQVVAMNIHGQIVGSGDHAISWKLEAGMVDLGTLGGVQATPQLSTREGRLQVTR